MEYDGCFKGMEYDGCFKVGESVIVFDAQSWKGDVGNNAKYYKKAKILKLYFYSAKYLSGGDWVADVQFEDGRISKAHFVSGLIYDHKIKLTTPSPSVNDIIK